MSILAFYSGYNIPDYIVNRTKTEYQSMSLDEFKRLGFWNKRLDKILPLLPDKAWIAGGFLRAMIAGEDEHDGDVDFFFGSNKAFEELYNIISKPNDEAKKVFGWYKAPIYDVGISQLRTVEFHSEILCRPKLQLIKLYWYSSPEHVIDNFDFTVCQLAMDKNRIYFGPTTFDDIKNRIIKIHRVTGNSLSTLNRILKYQEKKYEFTNDKFIELEDEAIKIMGQPNQVNEYFYVDYDETKTHKRETSFLSRTWHYLENSPKSADAYKQMLKNRHRPRKKTFRHYDNLGS